MDYGDEAWIYTAHFFPKALVPAKVVDPCKKMMLDKANNPKLFSQLGPFLDLWAPESQDKE